MRKKFFLAGLCLLMAAPDVALAAGEPETVVMDELEISAPKDTTERISQTEIERKTATNLWEALRGVPGVYQGTSDGRGESKIYIRGSNQYQVGMYMDGVPTTTAYRNEPDYNNFMVFDVESIEVSKGYSSVLLQQNNGLAGVIDVRSAKPQKELEFGVKYMNFFDRYGDDQGRLFGVGLGTRQDKFYMQAQVMHNEQDFYTMSHSFAGNSPYQDNGRRNNSDYENKRLHLIAGVTPTENIDIMFGVVRQKYEKGQPPDAASAPFRRFWRWDNYETNRYYTNVDMQLSDLIGVRLVGYFDEHSDVSDDYTDHNYNAVAGNNRHQTYDDYTAGGQIITDFTFNDANKLSASFGYRRLSHKEHRYAGAGQTNWRLNEEAKEDYYDIGLEYTWNFIDPLTLVLGAGYTRLQPDTSKLWNNAAGGLASLKNKNDVKQDMFNYQVGVFYDLTENHQTYFTFAHKERAATMRERYWKNSATGEPANPDIDPEEAFHFELGYRGTFDGWLKLSAGSYYSMYKDKIQQIGPAGNTRFENLDEADVWGLDLGAEALITHYLSLGATASFMDWDTDADKPQNTNVTNAPKSSGTVYAVISPVERLAVIPELYMTHSFYNDADPDAEHKRTPGFATINVKATYDVNESLMLEAGVKNLFDKDYYYEYYYPQAGMSFFTGLKYTF